MTRTRDDMTLAEQVGFRIRLVRMSNHYSLKEFASEIGITMATLAKYEYGQRTIKEIVIYTICSRFGISEDWLLHGTNRRKRECATPVRTRKTSPISKRMQKAKEIRACIRNEAKCRAAKQTLRSGKNES